MISRLFTISCLIATQVLTTALAESTTTYENGDLLLGFRASEGTGATQNYVVNIGPFTNVVGLTSTKSLVSDGSIAQDLASIFGPDWHSRADVYWSVSGTTGSFASIAGVPAKTLFATCPDSIAGVWTRSSPTAQGITTTKMRSFASSGFKGRTSSANNPNAAVQEQTDLNSYGSFQNGGTPEGSGPSGISFAYFNPTIEGTFEKGANNTSLDLIKLEPASLAEIDTAGVVLGKFRLSSGGTLTFTPNGVVDAAPSITTQPLSGTLPSGGSITLSVVASGPEPISYQWRKDNVAIQDATASTLTVNSPGSYTVSVTNSSGSATSSAAIISAPVVLVAPSITKQPVGGTFQTLGSISLPFTLSVTVSGSTPLTYQWRKDGVNILGASSSALVATTPGSYSVVISNSAGSVTSASAVVTSPVVVTKPAITKQPLGGTLTSSGSFSLSVTASGSSPLKYQWRKDGTNIGGATTASFIAKAAGSYSVVVSNSAGSVTSAGAVVTAPVVVAKPAITKQPVNTNLATNASTTLSVVASGSSPLKYQWRNNGVNIAGATSASLSVRTAGSYSVVVSNSAGSVTSAVAVVKTALSIPSLAADYQGLIIPTASASAIDLSAAVSASVSSTGSITGKIVRRTGTPQTFTGKVDSFGNVSFSTGNTPTIAILNGSSSLGSLSLELASSSTGRRIIGKVTSTSAGKSVESASLVATPTLTPASALNGTYTALFQQVDSQLGAYPDGDGYAAFSVSSAGISLTGKLADGSPISASLKLSENASCPLFIPLYSGKGLLSGNIRFDATQAKSDAASSDMRWFKSSGVSSPANYTAGWTNGIKVDFVASKYNPAKGFGFTNTSGSTLKFSAAGADLKSTIAASASLSATNTLSAPASSPIKLKPVFDTKTGAITGTFTPSGSSTPTAFAGVVIQKAGYASGFFLNNNKSGVFQIAR